MSNNAAKMCLSFDFEIREKSLGRFKLFDKVLDSERMDRQIFLFRTANSAFTDFLKMCKSWRNVYVHKILLHRITKHFVNFTFNNWFVSTKHKTKGEKEMCYLLHEKFNAACVGINVCFLKKDWNVLLHRTGANRNNI